MEQSISRGRSMSGRRSLSRRRSLEPLAKPDQTRVSVIMPTFNAAATLLDAARSVLNQTLSRLELIIVDDGSVDGSPGIASSLATEDPRVRVFRLPANVGPAAARNIALRAARGDWVAPVDADDWIAEERFEVLCGTGEREDADLIADAVDFTAADGRDRSGLSVTRMHGTGEADTVSELTIDSLLASDIPLNGARSFGYLKPVIRRAFLGRVRLSYDEDLRFAEDLNLYARALLSGGRFLLHPGCYYEYRQTPVSASRNLYALPRCAAHALANNRRIRSLVSARGRDDLLSLLDEHEQRWNTVLWFNAIKLALRSGNIADAFRATVEYPRAMNGVLTFVRDRSKAKRRNRSTRHRIQTESATRPWNDENNRSEKTS